MSDATHAAHEPATTTPWEVDRFADVRVLRYEVPGFDALPLRDKKLAYYLTEAALAGRDITWDQNHASNLVVRKTIEALVSVSAGEGDPAWAAFLTWAKRVWFSKGIHHHYSTRKFEPGFGADDLSRWMHSVESGSLPIAPGGDVAALAAELSSVLFDEAIDAVRVEQRDGVDVVTGSANNFYRDVTQADVEAFYSEKIDGDDDTPISHGLNSQLVRCDDGLVERAWHIGGLYSEAIEEVVLWLERAIEVAENAEQRAALTHLVRYYRTGDLEDFDRYSVAWVKDTESRIDTINGFIETYGDSLGYRGTWEALVSFKDLEASKRMTTISSHAQWFEANSSILEHHKKEKVTGIMGTVITVTGSGGDSSPTLPLGVNLPNADWIRRDHGSKSVSLGNIGHAYHEAGKGSGLLEEFALTDDEVTRAKAHGFVADHLHTDLHEVIGHASGRLDPGVAGLNTTLKQYASTLEEARADLVGLYFLMDPKLIELGLMESLEVGRAAYDDYIRNGLMVQLARITHGDDIEQAHMRNRHLVSKWTLEHGDGAIERVDREGKTYFVVRDYDRLRVLFGELLREVQRIKSEGDFEAGKALVETYGIKVEPELHAQVLARYNALDLKPYSGFIAPRLVPLEEGGQIVDVTVEYPRDFTAQMLRYGREHATLSARPSAGGCQP
ncbi:MAG: dipeptidyl-peptidase 3 family protein [Myxococcota bacterium]